MIRIANLYPDAIERRRERSKTHALLHHSYGFYARNWFESAVIRDGSLIASIYTHTWCLQHGKTTFPPSLYIHETTVWMIHCSPLHWLVWPTTANEWALWAKFIFLEKDYSQHTDNYCSIKNAVKPYIPCLRLIL